MRPLCCLLLFAFPAAAQSAEEELAPWIPPTTNTLAVVRVRELLDSPVGKQQQWRNLQRDAYVSGTIATPPGIDLMVRATEFQLGGGDAPTYTLFRTATKSVVDAIARKQKTPTERIADRVAVRANDQYFAQLAPQLMGSVSPANRQTLSRWLKTSTASAEAGHQFLRDAVLTVGDDAQVVIAIDLADMFEPQLLSRWLSANPGGQKFAEPDAVATLFATVQGVRLSIHVTDTIAGRLRVTLGQPAGPRSGDIAKVVLAWLDESGARVGSGPPPAVTADGNNVTLEAALDVEGIRRVMSLIRSPHAAHAAPATETAGEPAPVPPRTGTPDLEESSRYFTAVNKLVDSLNRQNRRADDYLKTAMWHENFAQQIDQLPTDGVDPELVAWSHNVSTQLTALAKSLRGVPLEVNELQKTVRMDVTTERYWVASNPYTDFYRPGNVSTTTNLVEVRTRQAAVVAENAQQRDAVWQFIGAERAAVSKNMREKYGTTFGKVK
jgi:hypothetical protein